MVRFEDRRRFVIGLPALVSACAAPGPAPAPVPAPPPTRAPAPPVSPTPPGPPPAPPTPPAPPPPAPQGAVTSPVPSSPAPPTPAPASSPLPAAGGWTDQPVFSLVRVQIRDERAFGDYLLTGHLPTIGAFGGRFLAAGALPQPVEGDWPLRRMIVHQWPSAQVFLQWYESSSYAPWRQIRQRAAETEMVLVQGIAPSAPAPAQPPAFVVTDLAVRDPAAWARYAQGRAPGLRAAGGEMLVADGHFQLIEGAWEPRRLSIQRWPSMAAFRHWYESAGYRPWRDLRWSVATGDIALIEGLSEAQKAERRIP